MSDEFSLPICLLLKETVSDYLTILVEKLPCTSSTSLFHVFCHKGL